MILRYTQHYVVKDQNQSLNRSIQNSYRFNSGQTLRLNDGAFCSSGYWQEDINTSHNFQLRIEKFLALQAYV